MARYTGPKRKVERRLQASVFSDSNAWQKRPGAPGQHPFTRGRTSEYGIQLREVQRMKKSYGLLEKQFRRVLEESQKSVGNSGTVLLQLLETRLDNIVYRLGFAKTRNQARQFVNHGHVLVNGKKQSIPSYQVQVGDKIEVKPKLAKSEAFQIILEEVKEREVPDWLEAGSKKQLSGTLAELPKRDQMDQSINERLVIEFYSR